MEQSYASGRPPSTARSSVPALGTPISARRSPYSPGGATPPQRRVLSRALNSARREAPSETKQENPTQCCTSELRTAAAGSVPGAAVYVNHAMPHNWRVSVRGEYLGVTPEIGHRDAHRGALEDADCFVRHASRIPIAPAPPSCNAHFDAQLLAEPNTAHISPAAAKPFGPRRGNQIDGYQHTDYEQTDGKLSHTCPCGLLRLDS